MKNFQRGFSLRLLLAILFALAASGGAYWYWQSKPAVEQVSQHSTTSNMYTPLFAQDEGPGSPDCYYSNGDHVYLSTDRGKNFTLVSGADTASFKDRSIFGLCFGTDKNHAYRDTQMMQGYDSSAFKLLWYAKTSNGPVLFIERDTSSIGAFSFSEDSDSAYVSTTVIPNSDPQTFKELVGAYDFGSWASDKNNVYCGGKVLSGADPSTVTYQNHGVEISVAINGVNKTVDSSCRVLN